MKFLDQAKIYIKSGNGGNGCISFREKNMSNLAVQMEAMVEKEVMSLLNDQKD